MNRLTAVLLVVLLAPILLIGVLLYLIANPDYYRDALAERFYERTGMTLGSADLAWRYFPPIALTLENVRVEGASGDPLASLEAATIDVALWPLLTDQRVEIQALTIEGANINLVQDENGQGNWQMETADGTDAIPGADAVAETPDSSADLSLKIERIEFVNSQLQYQDQVAGTDVSVQLTSLTTGAVEPGKPVDVAMNVTLTDAAGLNVQLEAAGDITVAPDDRTISLEAFRTQVNGAASGTPFDADITSNTYLDMSRDATQITTEISGSVDALSVTGNITAILEDIPQVSGELHVTTLDLNPYLAEDAGAPSGDGATEVEDAPMIPVGTLRSVDLELAITADALMYDTYSFTNLATQIDNDENLTLTATFNGYGGDFRINSQITHDDVPITDTTVGIDNVDIAAFAELDWITGALALESTTQLTGAYQRNLNDQLTGTNRFVVTNGSMDITTLRRVVQLVATLTRQTYRVADWPDRLVFEELHGELMLPSGLATGQQLNLKADEFTIDGTGGVDIVAREVDYALQLAFEEAPPAPDPDSPRTEDQLVVDESLTRISWPVTCAGSLDDSPATLCLPDREAVRDVVRRLANEKVAEKGEELIEKAKQKLEEKIPQNVRDKAKDLFDGLFNE
ncbi:MAG: AsmA family protein [Pseudomonadota bacterium]